MSPVEGWSIRLYALPLPEASIKLLYHFFVGFCCVAVGVGFLLVCALGVGVEVPAGGGGGGERLGAGFLKLFRGLCVCFSDVEGLECGEVDSGVLCRWRPAVWAPGL